MCIYKSQQKALRIIISRNLEVNSTSSIIAVRFNIPQHAATAIGPQVIGYLAESDSWERRRPTFETA